MSRSLLNHLALSLCSSGISIRYILIVNRVKSIKEQFFVLENRNMKTALNHCSFKEKVLSNGVDL